MEIDVLVDEEFQGNVDTGWLKDIAGQALATQQSETEVEMGLVITGQEKIRELNRSYRGRDEATDVLAFPMLPRPAGVEAADFTPPPDGLKHLGEVIISYPQAVRQAEERGQPLKKELAILIIHGVLHLLGYDHAEPGAARLMKEREAEILKAIEGRLE